MRLGDDQVKGYLQDGYLFFPGIFAEEEIDALQAETRRMSAMDIPQRVLEEEGDLVRTIYGSHDISDLFGRLVRDPRALEPARQLLDGDVYVFQTKLNPKAPIRGDVWEWHQDFVYWSRDDGMPRPDVVNVAVFLDDVTEFNGPLFVIPGSHHSVLDEDTMTLREGWWSGRHAHTADGRHKLEREALARMVDRHGLVSVTGRRGSVCLFHPCLLHASPPNLAPYFRTMIFIRYCGVTNVLKPMSRPRPEWLACRRPLPVRPLDEPMLAVAAAAGSSTGRAPNGAMDH
ncbi:MAG TPA: phytanoyl-CoA dioxygenase family protein [Streptosporangiaceae bacterium]|nr:phytanoyl-CoA dioxygenase family protein [Streptosporangiaceae bacterium]